METYSYIPGTSSPPTEKSGAETCIHGLGGCQGGVSGWAAIAPSLAALDRLDSHLSRDPDCIGSVPAPQGLNAEAAGRGGERIRPLELSWPRLSRHPSRDDAIRGGRGSGKLAVALTGRCGVAPDGGSIPPYCPREVTCWDRNQLGQSPASARPAASDPNRIPSREDQRAAGEARAETCIHAP